MNGHPQAHPFIDGQPAGAGVLDGGHCLGAAVVGHESQTAQVHPEQGNAVIGHQPRRVQQRAVAAQDRQGVDGGAQRLGRHDARGGQDRRVFLQCYQLATPLQQDAAEVRRDLTSFWLAALEQKAKTHCALGY